MYIWSNKCSIKGKYKYFVIFTDDCSRYGYIYLMLQKSKVFGNFQEYKARTEK